MSKLLMVHHGKRGKCGGKGKVRKSGSLCLTLVDGSVCHKIPADRTRTRPSYVIYRTDDVNCCSSDTERPPCFWMQMIIPSNDTLAVKNEGINFECND